MRIFLEEIQARGEGKSFDLDQSSDFIDLLFTVTMNYNSESCYTLRDETIDSKFRCLYKIPALSSEPD